MKVKYLILIAVLLLASFSMGSVILLYGSIDVPTGDVFSILSGGKAQKESWSYIVERRLSRGLASFMVCGILAVAGMIMQTIFKNPLSGPSVLGISSGASLGVAVVVLSLGSLSLSGLQYSGVFVGSLLGSLLSLALVFFLGKRVKNNTVILIGGMMFSYLASAIVQILIQKSDATAIQQYALWGLGSFSHISLTESYVISGITIVTLISLLLFSKSLNAMLMGDKFAKGVGVDVQKSRLVLIIITGLITGLTVAFCGPIAFVGIAIPHLARFIFSENDHFYRIPFVFLLGGLLGLLCSFLSETPFELPVNAITSLIGAPIVLLVLLKNRKRWIR